MSQSPNIDANGLVTYTIYSEGEKIKDTLGIISIWVYKEVNRIGKAQLIIQAGDMPSNDIPESDDDTFAPGKSIKIEVGYNSNESVIFEGIVTAHSLDISDDAETRLRIDCRDYAFPMTQLRKNRVFEQITDSAAISNILRDYSSLTPTVGSTETKYNAIVQYYSTDWDFILSKADANGLVVTTEGKNITIKKPALSASAALKVTYGESLVTFNGQLQAASQVTGATAVAWDMASQALLTASGTKPSMNEQGDMEPGALAEAIGNADMALQVTTVPDKNALQTWADAQMLKTAMGRITGDVSFQGSSLITAGDMIELDGLGKRFNGAAYAGKVEHDIAHGNWVTIVGMGMRPVNITDTPNVSAPAASGLLPAIQGLQIGKVLKIDEDPDKENKIQVEVPLLNGEKNNIWVRLASFWASSTYGAFFIPDVGDEVVLGFFNDNPNHGVVLGSLYSSNITPSTPLTADNYTRSIVTKSKLTMKFDEDKKVITFETPGKNIIEINDDQKSISLKDQNSNKIVMSDSGITIESAQSLTLKAGTGIEMSAGTDINIKGTSGISMKGMKIEASADTSFTAKGNAQAELSAAGQVTVKGAIVMIN